MEPIIAHDTDIAFEPIQLPKVLIRDRMLTPTIIEEHANPIHSVFKIIFSDATEVIAFSSEGGWRTDNRFHSSYVKAIAQHLDIFSAVKNYHWNTCTLHVKGSDLFVWIAKQDDDEHGERFCVYFDDGYQFHLQKRKGQWGSFSTIKYRKVVIDQTIATQVATAIESLFED